MKQFKPFLIIAIFSITFGSCKKNKDVQDPPVTKTYLVKEDYASGTLTHSYDNQNRLVKSEWADKTSSNNNYTLTVTKFNAAGNIEEMLNDYANPSYGDTRNVVFYNSAGKIEKLEEYYITGTSEYHSADYLYTYNSGVETYSRKAYPSGTAYQQSETTIDANGNYSQVKSYTAATGTLAVILNYNSFDDKKSPFLNMPQAISGTNPKNNPLTVARTVVSSGVVSNIVYSYEYNADGYPTKRTTVVNGGTPSITNYEYVKK